MAIPLTAILFRDPMDPQEVLEFEYPMLPILETSETIDPDPSKWTLELGPEAAALGLEIIESDLVYPDPALIDGNTTIKAWFRVDQAFAGNAAWLETGTRLPTVATFWTNSVPPRRRQRTFLMTTVEQ